MPEKLLKSFGRLKVIERNHQKLIFLNDENQLISVNTSLNQAKHEGRIKGMNLTKDEYKFLISI